MFGNYFLFGALLSFVIVLILLKGGFLDRWLVKIKFRSESAKKIIGLLLTALTVLIIMGIGMATEIIIEKIDNV